MDGRHYAESYRDVYRDESVYTSPEANMIMEGPRKWSSFFDSALTHALLEDTPDAHTDIPQLTTYMHWAANFLPGTTKLAQELAHEDPRDESLILELNFHQMTAMTTLLWESLLDEEKTPTLRHLYDMQTILAMSATGIARQRKILMTQEEKSGERSGMVGIYNGQLTEIDTFIILIETMKEDPEGKFIAVAAPPKYESGARHTQNADFIVYDKKLKHARGIQVKTRVSLPYTNGQGKIVDDYSKYSREHITLIDGFTDLGNSQQGTGNYRGKIVAAPGLISMDHLQRSSIKDIPLDAHDKPLQNLLQPLMRAKGIAREISGQRKNYIPHAMNHVKEKIIYDLYRS